MYILLFSAAVSLDLAAAAFALGSGGIKIPHISAAVISLAGALLLAAPALFGDMLFGGLETDICRYAGKGLLTALGLAMIGRHFLKKRKKKRSYPLSVCIDEGEAESADINKDRKISAAEAAVLGLGLSADSAVTGFSAGLSGMDRERCFLMFLCTFVIGILAVELGGAAGRKFSAKVKFSNEIISGIIMIAAALIF